MSKRTPFTPAQRAMLEALREACDRPIGTAQRPAGWAAPRELAMRRWPDSPGWKKRTRKFGGHTGAVGGTMPMKAATVLWRLLDRGLASKGDHNEWSITDKGRRVLAGTEEP